MDCYLCGQPAVRECQRCGNPYCAAHGDKLCSRCAAPGGLLVSPVLYKGALVVLILAIASAGWYLYKWPWPSASSQKELISAASSAVSTPAIVDMTPEATPAIGVLPTPVATAVASIQHVVEPGDSLLYIALKYNTTVEAITSLNGITDPHALKIGQVLLIPATTPTAVPYPTAIPAGLRTHTVEQGETLLDIALKYDTTVEAIAALNGIADPYPLQIGQALLIPK